MSGAQKMSLKNMLPRSLFARSLLILIVPVILIQLITSYVFFDRHWNKMTARLAFGVAGEISYLTDAFDEEKSNTISQKKKENAAKYFSFDVEYEPDALLKNIEEKALVFNPKNIIWELAVVRRLSEELEAMVDKSFTLDFDSNEKWVRVYVQLDGGVLYVGLPQRRLFSSSGYVFLLWMMGASFLLLFIAILFMRNQIRPIRRLAIAADRLGKGRDIPAAFKPQGAREVRMAAQAFLDMDKRIRRQIEQRTTMLAGVSHDLRTPLTRLKLQLAMLGDSPDIDAMRGDIIEMEKMIGGYLDFVRGEGDEAVSYIDFNDMLDKIVSAAKRQNFRIRHDIEGDIHINLRPMAVERCLMNIISNAGKYGEQIWVKAVIVNEELSITIEDDGPGIPKDQYEDVFRPFYRVDESRNTQTGGVGLGLPIAMDVVHSHGGKVCLEKSTYGGLKVCICLPL